MALELYNNKKLELVEKRKTLQKKMDGTRWQVAKQKYATQLSKIHPSMQASDMVSELAMKGPFYAHHIRHIAHQLLQNNINPESQRGKGAFHFSHFDNPDVKQHLRRWADGLIPEAKGGWIKRIRPEKLSCYVNDFLFPSSEYRQQSQSQHLIVGSRLWDFGLGDTQRGFIMMAMSERTLSLHGKSFRITCSHMFYRTEFQSIVFSHF